MVEKSASPRKAYRSEAELDALAKTLFTENPECDVLCDELQAAEDLLSTMEADPTTTSTEKAPVVARIRALNNQRKALHCALPCFFK